MDGSFFSFSSFHSFLILSERVPQIDFIVKKRSREERWNRFDSVTFFESKNIYTFFFCFRDFQKYFCHYLSFINYIYSLLIIKYIIIIYTKDNPLYEH